MYWGVAGNAPDTDGWPHARFKDMYMQPSNEPDTDGWPTYSIYSYVYATQQWAWHWWLINFLDLKLRICNPAMSLTLMVDQLARLKATYMQPSNEPDTDGWPTCSI